jgi:DNA-3-methyladenine glycosylase I
MNKQRCAWLDSSKSPNELYVKYHDEEWGVTIHDDRLLFEFLILEGAQAGLSWSTILMSVNWVGEIPRLQAKTSV